MSNINFDSLFKNLKCYRHFSGNKSSHKQSKQFIVEKTHIGTKFPAW